MYRVLIFSLVILFSFLPKQAETTSLILQVVLVEKWFKTVQKYNTHQKQEFVLGALFHNISYLEDLNYDPEINQNITLEDIASCEDPFKAGQIFYDYIVLKRDRLKERWSIYEHLTILPKDQRSSFLKLLEDELLYDPQTCVKAMGYLSSISDGEITTGIDIEKIAIWHGILYSYLGSKPSKALTKLKSDKRVNFSINAEGIDIWKAALVFLSTSEKIKNYLEDLLNEFDVAFELFRLKYLK